MIDVEELIPADHKARAIWELVGRLDLSRFTAPLRSTQGDAGRQPGILAYSSMPTAKGSDRRARSNGGCNGIQLCSGWRCWNR
jgi:hypothetical protein